ncbi:hypothetical protein PSTT_01009, partial [Puccinia striiformis]
MLPKNLISFVALHAPIIIHATLAMTLSHQVIEGSEDIKSRNPIIPIPDLLTLSLILSYLSFKVETAPITGEVDFGDEFDEVKCRQNKETIGSMKKDMTVIREHISWLETVHESIFWDVQNKLKQMDLHLTKHIRAKIIQLDGKHPEAEPIAFWGVVGKKENNLLGIEHTHADLQEDHFQSREIKTLGTQAHKEEWLSTKKVQSSPAHVIVLAVEHWNTEKLVHIWNDLQTKINNWKIDAEKYDNINWNDLQEKINNWEIDAEKYDNIKNIFVSIKCLFLFANFIKRYHQNYQEMHHFGANVLGGLFAFRLRIQWKFIFNLTLMIISYLSLKEYIKTFEADCQTGLENFSFILEESSHNGSLGRLDNLSSEIRRFTINYYFIDFIKNFYKNVFDELKPVDNKGNSLVFQAKMKLVEDYLIYTQDKVGNQNLMHLKEHHDNLFMENNPGSATYFDWSSPFVSSLLKL